MPFRASLVTAKRVSAPPNSPVIVIFPGFGNAAEDYTSPPPPPSPEEEEEEEKSPLSSLLSSFLSSSSDSEGEEGEGTASVDGDSDLVVASSPPPSLSSALAARGFSVSVVPLKRSDWLRVARCAVDPAYWRGEAEPETAYGWYLDLAERAVEEAASANPSGSGVVLLAHSAGGWLGRALLGRWAGDPPARKRVRALCTLGTPHAHNETARCVTGGALARVNELWPGAFYSSTSSSSEEEKGDGDGKEEEENSDIRYVAVAGRAVLGDVFAPRGTLARAAAAAYSQVAGGDGHGVAGDGKGFLSFIFFGSRFPTRKLKKKRKKLTLSFLPLSASNLNEKKNRSRPPVRRDPPRGLQRRPRRRVPRPAEELGKRGRRRRSDEDESGGKMVWGRGRRRLLAPGPG